MLESDRTQHPTNGQLLMVVAVGHALVGACVYRSELRQIGSEGVAGTIPYHGEKATAFWFLLPSPLLWILARLLHRAEMQGDHDALRAASRAGVISSLLAVLCLPISGFWAWTAISLRGLWHARRMAR